MPTYPSSSYIGRHSRARQQAVAASSFYRDTSRSVSRVRATSEVGLMWLYRL